MIWRRRSSNPGTLADWGRGRLADFFLRPPTLTASNFAALWPTDSKFSTIKDLNLFKRYTKNQKAGSILKVDFALSKWPHFNSIYLVRVPFLTNIAVSSYRHFQQNLLTRYKEMNDTLFESPYIEHSKSGKKLGVALSWSWPCPPIQKKTSFARICLKPFMTKICPVSNLLSNSGL